MLRNDTVQPKLCGKKVFAVLCFFLVVLMFIGKVASAASWIGYDAEQDGVLFDYTDIIDFLQNHDNTFMRVGFVRDNDYETHGVQYVSYLKRDLTGLYYATNNGLYTITFFQQVGPNEVPLLSGQMWQTIVTQVQNPTRNEQGNGPLGFHEPYEPDEGEPGEGDNGNGSGGGGDCIGCDMFKCPGWDEYMSKIDEIRNAIPPPPNWDQVADTFYDRVVPRMINDLENMLGTAPPPPSSPPVIEPVNIPTPNAPEIDDYSNRLEQNTPQMQDNPALEDSTFTADDIRNQAPEIEFREDESGGFDLPTSNPVDSLPELPFEGFPVPGMGSAGEWDHQPEMPSNPFPMPSDSGGGTIDPGEPPIPSGGSNEPPVPGGGDSGNSGPPLPGQEYNPPMPGGGFELPGGGNYKLHPDDPDGSG